MILGIGIDIISVQRMEAAIERGRERLLERLFNPGELADAAGGAARAERLAARFAAKEAAFKAIGTGWSQGVSWRDIEVVRQPSGQPMIHIAGRALEIAKNMGVIRAHLSLSHQGGMAAAVVVLEGQE